MKSEHSTNARIHRRHFLIAAAGTAGVAAVGVPATSRVAVAQDNGESRGLPAYADWKNPDAVIIHTDQTIETKRDAVGTSVITPNEVTYIRNNLTPPNEEILADRDAWELEIEGVGEPRTVTLGELKTMGLETVATVLQCSGNGRGFFDHEASGSPWLTGAAGCVVWSGVPVRRVLEALGGPADGAAYMTMTGGETIPEGIDPLTVQVERSVPVEAADEAILAWEMNGEPMPLAHGGPLRIIVPGYYGINNVKYVKTLAFTDEESQADIQTSGYRVRPVGESGAPDQPSMWEMKVKSWITHPVMDNVSGRVQIHGVAFGGMNSLDKVEVSLDGGESWEDARFTGPDLGRYGWRVFVLEADLEPGDYVLTSRATDADGNVQEETTEPNHRAYDYAGWDRLAIDLTVA